MHRQHAIWSSTHGRCVAYTSPCLLQSSFPSILVFICLLFVAACIAACCLLQLAGIILPRAVVAKLHLGLASIGWSFMSVASAFAVELLCVPMRPGKEPLADGIQREKAVNRQCSWFGMVPTAHASLLRFLIGVRRRTFEQPGPTGPHLRVLEQRRQRKWTAVSCRHSGFEDAAPATVSPFLLRS